VAHHMPPATGVWGSREREQPGWLRHAGTISRVATLLPSTEAVVPLCGPGDPVRGLSRPTQGYSRPVDGTGFLALPGPTRRPRTYGAVLARRAKFSYAVSSRNAASFTESLP
jgi:hypothetical protein